MSTFSGKVAVVTGASSGIGQAIAVMLAERGASVVLCGRNQERLQAARQKCLEVNGNHQDRLLLVSGDLLVTEDRKQIVEQTVKKFGRLDILIPNAGVAEPQMTIETATEDSYDRVMNTNLRSIFFLIQDALPHLQESKGNIVCMSSAYASMPSILATVYAFAKAGLEHLVQSLSMALGPKGIRVNAVKPSYIATNITRNHPNHEVILAEHPVDEAPLHPLEGRGCTLEEVAEVTLFLASSAASFVTGECVHVDGGRRFSPECAKY